MGNQLKILVKCPNCGESLVNPDVQLDKLDAIHFQAKIGDTLGDLYLSQVYGSYTKRFDRVENIDQSIVECSCPHCHVPFPFYGICECKAPVIGLDLQMGGTIKVCTRNGCKKHWLEFENANDAFFLFQCQSETDLM